MAVVRLLTLLVVGAVLACPGVAAARAPQPLAKVFAPSYTPSPDVAQTYVDFLGSLPHGTELSKLKLLLAPPTDVQRDCGGQDGVLACYDSQSHEMVVPGEQIENQSGVSTSYVIAHEYGHHIAAFRSNPPFPTVDVGPKYWASYEKICDRTLAGRLAPGDEGQYYLLNPGENWAETYARLVYPNEPWRFTSLLKPDAGALAAARRDVLEPWTASVTKTFTGSFGGGDVRRFSFPLTLDGAPAASGGPRTSRSPSAGARAPARSGSPSRTQAEPKGAWHL